MEYIKKNMEPLAIGAGVGLFLCGWTTKAWVFGKVAKLKAYYTTNPPGTTIPGFTFP